MPTKEELRARLRDDLDATIMRVNAALKSKNLRKIEPVLMRIGRGKQLPHWFAALKKNGTLPNLDGKTIGSVVEMILVGVLETSTFADMGAPPLRINPARGVDLPDLDLGVKSPSENYCTSEPFFSAYERLLGTDHDALVLLTDYQTAKSKPPLRLQIIKWRYLKKSEIADEALCRTARELRGWVIEKGGVPWAQKVFRFLAYINQSDWRAKRLLRLVNVIRSETEIESEISASELDFDKQNKQRLRKDRIPVPDSDLAAIVKIRTLSPLYSGVIDAADNWVIETQKDAGRFPNSNEWPRLETGALDGKIGMSFALQWRYNFGRLFGAAPEEPTVD
jgi:hypothetical protein